MERLTEKDIKQLGDDHLIHYHEGWEHYIKLRKESILELLDPSLSATDCSIDDFWIYFSQSVVISRGDLLSHHMSFAQDLCNYYLVDKEYTARLYRALGL